MSRAHVHLDVAFNWSALVLCFSKNYINSSLTWVKSTHRGLMMQHIVWVTSPCHRADFMLASSQWETLLQSNAISHRLGANLESALLSRLAQVMAFCLIVTRRYLNQYWLVINETFRKTSKWNFSEYSKDFDCKIQQQILFWPPWIKQFATEIYW